jgi:hypothetical protein
MAQIRAGLQMEAMADAVKQMLGDEDDDDE